MKKVFLLLFVVSLWSGVATLAQTSASKDRLQQHVYTLAADSMKGRGIGSPEGRIAAGYIAAQMAQAGVKPYRGHFLYPFSFAYGPVRAFGNNVVGIIEGSDANLKSEYVVVGAHYDHMGFEMEDGKDVIYNGADDNASGVATMLEIGHLLSQQKDALKRSVILVAFDGEESGLQGSSAMVDSAVVPLDKVKMMISVDMVGMLSANGGLNLKGSATLDNGNAIFKEVAQQYGIELKDLGIKVENRTDTQPFGRIGIPAIAPTTGVLSPYHKPEDDANLLDYEGMATITNFLTESILKVANQDLVVASASFANSAQKGKSKLFSAGVKVGIGTSKHRYPDEFYKAKPLLAAQVGIYGRMRLSHRISIQPEVQYETLGSKTANGNMRTHAINTPCSFLFDLVGNENYDNHVYVVLGGYHSYTFAGKVGGDNIDFDKEINRTDYGLNYGISVEGMGIQFGLVMKYGLTDILNSNVPGNIRNTAGYITMGYRF